MSETGDVWRSNLSDWAIPEHILNQATQSPWIHPPVSFQIPDNIQSTPSHQKVNDVLSISDSLLDIGCGGGIAAFGSQASHVIGVDHQSEMLEMFQENAKKRSRTSETFEGFWPDIESMVPVASVVTAYHVAYNVSRIEEFLTAMDSHCTKRVVLELPQRHPLSNLSEAWKHFWNLERPTHPTSYDLLKIIRELGFNANIEDWQQPLESKTMSDQDAEFMRIRLCLAKDRLREVKEFFDTHPQPTTRALSTIWWDKA